MLDGVGKCGTGLHRKLNAIKKITAKCTVDSSAPILTFVIELGLYLKVSRYAARQHFRLPRVLVPLRKRICKRNMRAKLAIHFPAQVEAIGIGVVPST